MHPTERQINDYADGSLTHADRASIAEHIDQCADCRALLTDFVELRRLASALALLEPPPRVWSRLEAATDSHVPSAFDLRMKLRWTAMALAKAARRIVAGPAAAGHQLQDQVGHRVRNYVLGVATAAILAFAAVGGLQLWRSQVTSTSSSEGTTAQSVEAELRAAEAHYQNAIAGLEKIAEIAGASTSGLDPRTLATLRENLAVVDRAIDESRAALRAQPDSDTARQSLLDGFRTKVILLQDTIELINDQRAEDATGRTRPASGIRRGI
jgi:anti-sigma factor RsiW